MSKSGVGFVQYEREESPGTVNALHHDLTDVGGLGRSRVQTDRRGKVGGYLDYLSPEEVTAVDESVADAPPCTNPAREIVT